MTYFRLAGLAVAFLCVLAWWGAIGSGSREVQKRLPSAAYSALIAWQQARAYPAAGLPDQGFVRAVDHSRHMPAAAQAFKLQDQWQSIGPIDQGGRTLALAVHPQNADLVYAGSASGGLWRSETGGRGSFAWQRVETGFPVLGVGAIAIHPTRPQQIYVGTGEVYNYQNAAIGIGDRNARGSYGIGILKSADGGVSWEMSLDWRYHQQRGIQDLAIHPAAPDRVWAATTEGLYLNEGAGWTRVLAVVMATSIALHPTDPALVLVACGNLGSPGHGIYRSTDTGQTWQKVTTGLPQTYNGKAILAFAPSAPDTLYASIGNGFDIARLFDPEPDATGTWLARSTDAGASFEIMSTENYADHQGWYSHFVVVDPEDEDRLLVGGIGFMISEDAGRHLINKPFEGPDQHAAVFAPSDSRICYLADDRGVFRSEDRGATLSAVNHGYHTTQFYRGMAQSATDAGTLFGSPQDYGGKRYQGGSLWQDWANSEGGYHLIDDEHDIFYHGGTHLLSLTRYQGAEMDLDIPMPETWKEIIHNTNFNAPLAMAVSQPDVLYAARDLVYRSQDRGDHWTISNGGQPLDGNPVIALAVSHQDAAVIYAATAPRNGPMHLFRSDDAESWTDITGTLPDRYPTSLAVDPNDDRRVLVTFSGFGSRHLFESTDGGANWKDIDRGLLPDVPASVVAIDPDHPEHLYLGNDVGVFASLNGGYTWFAFTEGLPQAVLAAEILIHGATRTLTLGTHGNGVYTRALLEPDPQGVLATTLLYPWVSNRAGEFESILIANNLDADPVEVTLAAARADGTRQTVTRRIAANGFLAERASLLFPDMGSGAGYSVRLTAPSKHIHGRWVTNSLRALSGQSPSQGVAVRIDPRDDFENSGDRIVFGYLPLNQGFVSAPVVINAGREEVDVDLRFYDEAGLEVSHHLLERLAPGLPFAEVANNLVPAGPDAVKMVAAAAEGASLSGVSFVFNSVFNETAIGNASTQPAPGPETGSRLIYPWISNNEGRYESILVAGNSGQSQVTVMLTARRETGDAVTVARTIAAGGFLAERAASLFPQLGSGSGYSVVLSSPDQAIQGQWVTNDLTAASGGSPSQGVAIAFSDEASASTRAGRAMLFGYMPPAGALTSAPVLVNLGEQPANVILYFYDREGRLLLKDEQTLAGMLPLRPFARLMDTLLPGIEEDVQMIARSDGAPLSGVAFIFNNTYFEPAIGNATAVDFAGDSP